MFYDIPYYKKNGIKNIRVDSDYYIVVKYLNSNKTFQEHRSLVGNDIEEIRMEYFNTLKDYLDKMNTDYVVKISRYKHFMEYEVKKNIIILIVSVLGMIIPFIGMIFKYNPFIFLGVPTVSLGGIGLSYVYVNFCNYKRNKKDKEFCDEYERLVKIYDNYLNKDIKHTNIFTVKPIINNKSEEKKKLLIKLSK